MKVTPACCALALLAGLALAWMTSCSSDSPKGAKRDALSISPDQGPGRHATTGDHSSAKAHQEIRWREVPITKDCAARIAENPEAFDPRLDWKPCTDGPTGRREVPINLGRDSFSGSRHLSGMMIDGAVTLVMSVSLPGTSPINRQAVVPLDGEPLLVIDQPWKASCSPRVAEVSPDGIVIEVTYDHADGYASRAYMREPFGGHPSWDEVDARLLRSEFPDFIGEGSMSVGGRVAVAASGGPVRLFDPEARKWSPVEGTKQGWACCFEAHGDYFSYMIESIPEHVMAARIGEPAHELRPVVKGGGTSPVAIDRGRAVWAEGKGRDNNNYYETIELWTGEISPDLKIDNARAVTPLPVDTMPRPRFHDGVAVVSMIKRGGVERLPVIRVADGETRILTAPDGLHITSLIWVTKDEIAVEVGPGYNEVGPSWIRRIPIASLPLMTSVQEGGALVSATHKSVWPGKPPLSIHTFDVTVQNPADGPRWILVPDVFPYEGKKTPAPGVGKLGELQIYELSKDPRVIISNGVGAHFWAVRLESGAQLTLRDLKIESWWEEIPPSAELEVLVATEVLVGGQPLEELFAADPTSKGGKVRAPKDAGDERVMKFWHPRDRNTWSDVETKVERRSAVTVQLNAR